VINTRKRTILQTFLLLAIACLIPNTLPILASKKIDLLLPDTKPKSYKSRMRQRSTHRKNERTIRTYKDMNYQELVAAKKVQVDKSNRSVAIKYIEQLMKICNDVTKLSEHLLEIADLFFQDEQFHKSARLYTEFSTLYPGHEKQEYALYRAIHSSFRCILSTDRDQTKTEESLALTEIFLLQEHFNIYREEIITIQRECYKKLAESDCNICSFYLSKQSFAATEKRLKQMRSQWLTKIPSFESKIIALETLLALKKEESMLLKAKRQEATQRKQYALNKKTKRMTERF